MGEFLARRGAKCVKKNCYVTNLAVCLNNLSSFSSKKKENKYNRFPAENSET